MADRYWVGGTATWNTTNTANWSATSGGASGASVPTSVDNAIFDLNSGVVTVTASTTITCATLSFTSVAGNFPGTFAGAGSTMNIYGGLTLVAGMTWSATGTMNFIPTTGTYDINTAGKTLSVTMNIGAQVAGAAVYNLQSALNIGANALSINSCTFNTNNYAITCFSFSSSGSLSRTINLGSSTITATSNGSAISLSVITNLTFNAGTSTFVFSGSNVSLIVAAAGLTFYNVTFSGLSGNTSSSIIGKNTFNNLTIARLSSIQQLTIVDNLTVTAVFTVSSAIAGYSRTSIASSVFGTIRTITVNGSCSLSDVDFRDIQFLGTASPVSGVRIGDLRGNSNIAFTTPKTVYLNGTSFTTNSWSNTDGGAVDGTYFPLAQDTAVITNTSNVSGSTITFGVSTMGIPTIDMSSRTNALTFNSSTFVLEVYGDWINGSGVSFLGTGSITFYGRKTQTIFSVGKTFTQSFFVQTMEGIVELADAFSSSNTLTLTSGTFNTNGYGLTVTQIASTSTGYIRTLNLGSSTVTVSLGTGLNFSTTPFLTINAGTSTIVTAITTTNLTLPDNTTLYNVIMGNSISTIVGNNLVFNNLTFTPPTINGTNIRTISGNITVNGTLTMSGTDPVHRNTIVSSVIGTQRTLTVNSLSANYCDFRDIGIAGAAINSSPTNAGDCGGNTGINFPAPKTVYWNLAGSQNWSATGWATTSGGVPATNNFPLAQDTCIFNDAGAATLVAFDSNSWQVGTIDCSSRTTGIILSSVNTIYIYGNLTLSSSVTNSITNTITFVGPNTQTLTSAGVSFSNYLTINKSTTTSTLQLADALTIPANSVLSVLRGTFNAVTYNVSVGLFSAVNSFSRVKMGTGTWTLTGIGTVWNVTSAPIFNAETANIVLSGTTATTTFAGGGWSYNKLTIGGNTSTFSTTITGTNQFSELASTRTVAHTIFFAASTVTTVGKWSITGTVGNVVTIASTAAGIIYTINTLSPTSGIDYLAISYCTVGAANISNFYVGANSTNTIGNTNVVFTATPAARTLFWVGGTGNWSDITHWATSSGGAGGAAIPTSLDSVTFDSASNATAYTVTIDAGVSMARSAAFSMSGPATGNVTFAGNVSLAVHGSLTFAASGITRTYTGTINLGGNTTGYVFTTNGLALANPITVIGIGSYWTLGSALTSNGILTVTNGTFDTGNFALTVYSLYSSYITNNNRTIKLGSSAVSLTSVTGTITFTSSVGLTFNAGTSTISVITSTSGTTSFALGSNLTYYNFVYTNSSALALTLTGENITFNNLTITANVTLSSLILGLNITVNGTLTFTSTSNVATSRLFVYSSVIGTRRTITCTAISAVTDVDFRDIVIAGGGAGVSVTRGGDCGGNSGIVFPVAKTVYWNLAGTQNWSATGWATTSGGVPATNNFPLAQDTCVFDDAGSAGTVTLNNTWNIGTIDASTRTIALTLTNSNYTVVVYGDWKMGTGITLAGTGSIQFSGRGIRTISSNGKAFSTNVLIDSVTGSYTLADALVLSTYSFVHYSGIFDAKFFNVTAPFISSSTNTSTTTKTLKMGSGTWTSTSSGSSMWSMATTGMIFDKGTANIVLTYSGVASCTFGGGNLTYNKLTIAGAGINSLSFSGNNIFSELISARTTAYTIALGTTLQQAGAFSINGSSGNVISISGTTTTSLAGLKYTGSSRISSTYLNLTLVRASPYSNTWYAGTQSVNNGTYGWQFVTMPNYLELNSITLSGGLTLTA